jgi:hypothetical protein
MSMIPSTAQLGDVLIADHNPGPEWTRVPNTSAYWKVVTEPDLSDRLIPGDSDIVVVSQK